MNYNDVRVSCNLNGLRIAWDYGRFGEYAAFMQIVLLAHEPGRLLLALVPYNYDEEGIQKDQLKNCCWWGRSTSDVPTNVSGALNRQCVSVTFTALEKQRVCLPLFRTIVPDCDLLTHTEVHKDRELIRKCIVGYEAGVYDLLLEVVDYDYASRISTTTATVAGEAHPTIEPTSEEVDEAHPTKTGEAEQNEEEIFVPSRRHRRAPVEPDGDNGDVESSLLEFVSHLYSSESGPSYLGQVRGLLKLLNAIKEREGSQLRFHVKGDGTLGASLEL